MKKQELREDIKLQKMKSFSNKDEDYYRLSSQMVNNVLQFPKYISSHVVGLFASKKASFEINTDDLIDKSSNWGKKVYLPRCLTNTHDLEFVHITDLNKDLEIGAFSLREPKLSLVREDQYTVRRELDIVCIPGVAFDLFGNRLGFGSGYYDKFLKLSRNERDDLPVIGLAFDFQVFDMEIPHNAKDEKVDYIVTPTSIFKTNS